MDDRNELVEQIRSRVEIALNQETRDAKKIDSASEFAERLRLSKQVTCAEAHGLGLHIRKSTFGDDTDIRMGSRRDRRATM